MNMSHFDFFVKNFLSNQHYEDLIILLFTYSIYSMRLTIKTMMIYTSMASSWTSQRATSTKTFYNSTCCKNVMFLHVTVSKINTFKTVHIS